MVGRSLQTSRHTVAKCLDDKLKVSPRSLIGKVEEITTLTSGNTLKLISDVSPESTKIHFFLYQKTETARATFSRRW